MKTKIFPFELIGKEIWVVDSTNKFHQGICGRVADETKSTLVIECNGKMKRLFKNNITFKLSAKGRVISGKEINKRPEERIKG